MSGAGGTGLAVGLRRGRGVGKGIGSKGAASVEAKRSTEKRGRVAAVKRG